MCGRRPWLAQERLTPRSMRWLRIVDSPRVPAPQRRASVDAASARRGDGGRGSLSAGARLRAPTERLARLWCGQNRRAEVTTAPRASISVVNTSKARPPSLAGWPSTSSSRRCGRTRNRQNSTLAGSLAPATMHGTMPRLRKFLVFPRKAVARTTAPQPLPYFAGLSSPGPKTLAVRLAIFAPVVLLRLVLVGYWAVRWWFKVAFRRMPATVSLFESVGLPAWLAWFDIGFEVLVAVLLFTGVCSA
jgi:hypothetical protein